MVDAGNTAVGLLIPFEMIPFFVIIYKSTFNVVRDQKILFFQYK